MVSFFLIIIFVGVGYIAMQVKMAWFFFSSPLIGFSVNRLLDPTQNDVSE
jgi:hypothetical protein